MNEGIAVFLVPITLFLVTGLVAITFFYLKSREKQMLIEKGLSSEEIKQFYARKGDPFILLKIGVIAIFFGLGLGIGMAMDDATSKEYWVPLSLFTITGIGFVVANVVGNTLRKKEQNV